MMEEKMDLLTSELLLMLTANGLCDGTRLLDEPPVAKLFTPDAAGTWLLSAIDPVDQDRAWGLCDPGLGLPELGWVSLAEIGRIRGQLGLAPRRDPAFRPNASLRAYAAEARRTGIVVA